MATPSPSLQPTQPDDSIASDLLARALAHYDVPFLAGNADAKNEEPLAPVPLMVALVTHHDARLRLALIPLLLCHPEFGAAAHRVVHDLPTAARTYFQCFYMAAHFLQSMNQAQLETYLGKQPALPELFSTELGLCAARPEEALRALGERQKQLGGRNLNWTGTYQHALRQLLASLAREKQWGLR